MELPDLVEGLEKGRPGTKLPRSESSSAELDSYSDMERAGLLDSSEALKEVGTSCTSMHDILQVTVQFLKPHQSDRVSHGLH
jgi:hypothetical protein